MVDNSNAKVIDKISIGVFAVLMICTVYLFAGILNINKSPIIPTHSKILYGIVMTLDLFMFYFTMLGDKVNKPINRPRIYFLVSILLAINIYSLIAEILNASFTSFLNSLLRITEVPTYLLSTNIKIITLYIPLIIVVLTFRESFSVSFKKETKKELLEYSIDLFTRNVNEVSHRTINVKLCEDINTGDDVILTESSSKQHMLISGSSGSGKTALLIRPILAQLFYQKATFQEKLKELAFESIKEGICYLKYPVTHKYANEYFSMDLIDFYVERKDEFLNKFKDYIIGIREASSVLHHSEGLERQLEIPLHISQTIIKREIEIEVYVEDLISETYIFSYENNIIVGDNINTEEYSINLNIKSDDDNLKEILFIDISSKNNAKYKYNVNIVEHLEGKIIYRDLGVTVVAPDGGLPSNTIEIAKKNGIKVHKIDPKMEEITAGNVARFNPLMVGTPEKAADVISSILVAMEQSTGKDSNPYFTNASIRAIRNLVILLRVTYPKVRGKNPTLLDVLDILNDFNLVKEYVEELQQDSRLEQRWKSVIDYFISSFYPQPIDDKGYPIYTTNEGVHRKKVGEAISGCINQLDNLLGREELRYILCDAENSLDLSEVLERGECLAIATRQSELGAILGKAFALLFILSMQNSVLCRFSEDENPEIPHYLTIDEFPFYLNENLDTFFTFARKYKCSMICAIQNILQLCQESEVFKQIIFSNTDTKMILPGSNVEDRKYYSEMLGIENVFESQTGISENPLLSEKANYSESTKGGMVEKAKVSTEEIADLKFKRCYYLYTNSKGAKKIGKGYIDFLKFGEDNIIKKKYYDFEEYSPKEYNKKKEDVFESELLSGSTSENLYRDIQEVELDTLELDNLVLEDIENMEIESDIEERDSSLEVSNLELEDNTINGECLDDRERSDKSNINYEYNPLERVLMGENSTSSNNNIQQTDKESEEKQIISNTYIEEEINVSNLDINKLEVEGLTQE